MGLFLQRNLYLWLKKLSSQNKYICDTVQLKYTQHKIIIKNREKILQILEFYEQNVKVKESQFFKN